MDYKYYGNFEFGATCTAFFGSSTFCMAGAGAYQEYSKTSQPEWSHFWSGPPYGDDPRDQTAIEAGANYYYEVF